MIYEILAILIAIFGVLAVLGNVKRIEETKERGKLVSEKLKMKNKILILLIIILALFLLTVGFFREEHLEYAQPVCTADACKRSD